MTPTQCALQTRVKIKILFDPRDLWIGLYWTRSLDGGGSMELKLYFCILPMVPILVTFDWMVNPNLYAYTEPGEEPRRNRPLA